MNTPENNQKYPNDPDYPILLEVPGSDAVRLDRDAEKRLIRDASVGGMSFTRIRTRTDYNLATIVASKDIDHRERKEKAAEVLLESIFGPLR